MVTLLERVSAREWPARPDLTTPAAVGRATKCENCNDSSGPQPSERREGVSTRFMTISGEVTFSRKRGSESGPPLPGAALLEEGRVMLRSERPPVSRVREIRKHGLKGGLALSLVTSHRRKGKVYQ